MLVLAQNVKCISPKDPRYFGVNPGGTTGAGYGELNSARPLNEDWHIR